MDEESVDHVKYLSASALGIVAVIYMGMLFGLIVDDFFYEKDCTGEVMNFTPNTYITYIPEGIHYSLRVVGCKIATRIGE